MGQVGREGQEEGVRPRGRPHTGTISGREPPGGPLPLGLDPQAGALEEDGALGCAILPIGFANGETEARSSLRAK